MAVDEYEATYKSYLGEFVDQVFEPSNMSALYSAYESLIQEYATQETSNFNSAVDQSEVHVTDRNSEVENFIN
ncbi:MAG: hypothetical protein GY816_21010 [Cytophagales bacterium]|nr:hypothetical protein [Cytophagales bacterium]